MNGLIGAIGIIVFIAAYFVPTIVILARGRDVPGRGPVIVVNVCLGWSVIGWIVALAMACRSKPRPLPPASWYPPPAGPLPPASLPSWQPPDPQSGPR